MVLFTSNGKDKKRLILEKEGRIDRAGYLGGYFGEVIPSFAPVA